jgi:predicted metal-binding membrane protein
MITTMERMHACERVLIGVGLVLLSLLAWAYLVRQAMPSGMATSMVMPGESGGGIELLVMSALMWTVMMVAMMLPSAGPMILTYARVHQRKAANGLASAPTWLFVAGYLAVWTGIALLLALAQWGFHESELLSSAMGRVGPLLGGGLLITAGAFQFSHLKEACLGKCRSPLGFLMTEWREGHTGAVIMGIRHGTFCTGCCWALMLLMFVGGVMSLTWMAGLALYFLVEKLLPGMESITRVTGALLIAAGVVLALAS